MPPDRGWLTGMNDFKTNEQLLFEAVQKMDRREVQLLIELGVNPNWQNADGMTALHAAAQMADTGIIDDLLAHPRIKADARDNDGQTPLHYAARHGRTASIRKLIAAKATVDARDKWQATPLMAASQNGKLEAVNLLLDNRAAPNAVDEKMRSALLYAVIRDHLDVVTALVNRGADPTLKDAYGNSPISMARNKNLKLPTQGRMAQFLAAAGVQKYLGHGAPRAIQAPETATFRKKSPGSPAQS